MQLKYKIKDTSTMNYRIMVNNIFTVKYFTSTQGRLRLHQLKINVELALNRKLRLRKGWNLEHFFSLQYYTQPL